MSQTAAPPTRSARSGWWVAPCAAALAFVVRFAAIGGGVGLRGYHGYDDGVYYAAAASFVHGRLPYRDFMFLHPPGVILAVAPFAALARWTGDETAFVAARLAFMAVGAASTVLVVHLARRWGMRAAVVGGVLYAVSAAAAGAERLTVLEPLGSLTLLAGVALLTRAAREGAARWWTLAGGAVLGLGLTVKIWDVVPVGVVLAWVLVVRGWRPALDAAAAAVGSAALVVLPFALADGPRMLRLVVLDQLGRPRLGTPVVDRINGIVGMDTTTFTTGSRMAIFAGVLALATAACWLAWSNHRGRLWVAVFAAQMVVLIASPSYFLRYSAFAAPAIVLVIAAATSVLAARTGIALAVAGGMTLGVASVGSAGRADVTFPEEQIEAALPNQGCISSDAPATLALLGVLSRDLAAGCQLPVDVSGQTYDIGNRGPHGQDVTRTQNQVWQKDALAYLTSGSATVLARGRFDGFDTSTRATFAAMPTPVHEHGIKLVLTGGADRRHP